MVLTRLSLFFSFTPVLGGTGGKNVGVDGEHSKPKVERRPMFCMLDCILERKLFLRS
jgi:hypothetical protein